MKKLIYGGLFLATVGVGIISCEKDEVRSNKDNRSNIKTDILNIFHSNKKKNTNKSLEDFN